jgi:adenosylcobinamide-GDP ribazoletransferase
MLISVALAVLPAALLLDGPLLIAALVSVCVLSLGILLLARRQIGGQTGDVLGATQQIAEVAALLAISAVTIAT